MRKPGVHRGLAEREKRKRHYHGNRVTPNRGAGRAMWGVGGDKEQLRQGPVWMRAKEVVLHLVQKEARNRGQVWRGIHGPGGECWVAGKGITRYHTGRETS